MILYVRFLFLCEQYFLINLHYPHLQSIVVYFQGSFSKNEFSFKVYLPATRQVEDSQIGDDDA